jgi:CheY-like chemotaxis protein/nitrogen-specific signal transduction histidine kinase
MQSEDFRAEDLLGQVESLAEALDAERAARDLADSADRAKSELLAVVSHELRTPIDAMVSMSELLLATPLDDTQRRYAQTLERSARSLFVVLNDLLDFSKLEAGHCELDVAPFDLHTLVKRAGGMLQAATEGKSLSGGVHIGTSCPRFVKGDAARLQQVLLNLTDNAIKFTEQGSVNLHVNAGEMEEGVMLRFDIVDTGVGLSESEIARLFQPYVQLERTAREKGGTGLGLYIARRLVGLMGGEIGCESVPGQGSLFWFVIPTERVAIANAAGAQDSGQLLGHVLVVEDNAMNRMLIATYLDEFGLTCAVVSSGAEALERLEDSTYDLVLMDILMPELDGVETTKRIRAMPGPVAEIPIVALTAYTTREDRATYLAEGLDAYVAKPIRGRELFDALAPYLPQAEIVRPRAAG